MTQTKQTKPFKGVSIWSPNCLGRRQAIATLSNEQGETKTARIIVIDGFWSPAFGRLWRRLRKENPKHGFTHITTYEFTKEPTK